MAALFFLLEVITFDRDRDYEGGSGVSGLATAHFDWGSFKLNKTCGWEGRGHNNATHPREDWRGSHSGSKVLTCYLAAGRNDLESLHVVYDFFFTERFYIWD